MSGLLDDFTYADGVLDGKGNWSGDMLVARDLKVESNEARDDGSGGNPSDQAYSTVFSTGGQHEAYFTIAALRGNSFGEFYLYVRCTNLGAGSLDGYRLRHVGATGSSQKLRLERIDNGISTLLGSQQTVEQAVGDILKVQHDSGGTLEAFVNGDSVYSQTDTTYVGTGQLGLGLKDGVQRADDFGGGVVSVGAAVSLLQMLNHLRFNGNTFALILVMFL